ncbi:uncharacterized protein LOC130664817 [Microplitis mediator]|uniref:uncharacterized protein LOC130664817 n=1 Tax=Microplitis mediator TaxID=375433 RepID=UPI002555B62E|nr:uncharacterized protein LOC130664817 [Microplitis mediator]
MGPIKKLFYVIKFVEVPSWEEEEYHVVPSSWVLSHSHEEAEAAFPMLRKTKLLKYITNRKQPNKRWPVFRVTTEFKTNVYDDALLYIQFRQNTNTVDDLMHLLKPKKESSDFRKCSVMNSNVRTFGEAYNDMKSAGRGSKLLKETIYIFDESSLSDSSSVTCENETSEVANTNLSYPPMPVNKIKAMALEHELLFKMRENMSEAAKLLEVFTALRSGVD